MKLSLREELVKICEEFPDLKIAFNYQIWETDFLRFYQSMTNYNITKESYQIDVDIYKGKKNYSFVISNPTADLIREKIESSQEFIDSLPEDPDFVDLEDTVSNKPFNKKDNNIEKVTLEKKVEILKKISDAVMPYKFKIFGTFICNNETNLIVNSNGVNILTQNSPIMLELKAVNDDNMVTVLQSYGSENIDTFEEENFISELVKKVKIAGEEIVDVGPGEYEVILAPRCIGEFISYLNWGGLNAGSLDRKNSFFEGKINEKIFGDDITISDIPNHPKLINYDYNSDGYPIKELEIIKNGVFKNFFVNNYYARKLKIEKNGNFGSSLVLEKGDKSLDEMISSTKKGLYISSLHYMNFINSKETSLTGLTRDGTFLIEDGKISKVVNNLRFTEIIVRILQNITMIEDTQYAIPFSGNYGNFSINTVLMPHVKLKSFKITSSTKTI